MNIIIFREILLPATETFISNQISSLTIYKGYYTGIRTNSNGATLQPTPLTIYNGGLLGKLQTLVFKYTGKLPPLFKKKLNNINPALCHTHFGTDAVYSLRLTKFLKIPLIVTFHGYDATSLHSSKDAIKNHKQRYYLKNRDKLIEQTSIFIAVSEFIKSELLKQGFPEKKILVHYTGIDTRIFSPDEKTKRKNIILFVGRLVEKKGLTYLLKAMSLLSNKHPTLQLIIIGNGPLRNQLENEAANSLNNYQFLGHQSSEVVKFYLQQSKLLCVPSIQAKNGDSEGFGMVFAEAQAVGTPVVSFKTGGIIEAVKNNHTGLLAKEKDSVMLSRHIDDLISNSKKWEAFSAAGIKRTKAKFDLKKQTKKLENIYSEIIHKSNTSQHP